MFALPSALLQGWYRKGRVSLYLFSWQGFAPSKFIYSGQKKMFPGEDAGGILENFCLLIVLISRGWKAFRCFLSVVTLGLFLSG